MSPKPTPRLGRIINLQTLHTVITPVDDDLLSGPEQGLGDIGTTVRQAVVGGTQAILGFPNLFTLYDHLIPPHVGRIFNITASTTAAGQHTRKVQISTVEAALIAGADAVGVHVNLSSRWEPEMLQILGYVGAECRRMGLPLFALMYPRKEASGGSDYNYSDLRDDNPEAFAKLVRHAVRVGVELGADVIKTIYTGTPESFATVVDIAMGVPVVIAGERKVSPLQILEKVEGAMQAGAAGIAGGRNVFNSGHIKDIVEACGDIVHRGMTAKEALAAHPALRDAK